MWYAHLKFSHWLPTAVIVLLPGLMAEGARAQTATVTIRAESATGPVAGVRILASDVIGLTNADGVALLTLGLGQHVIEADRIGFSPSRVELFLAEARDTTVTVLLEVVAIETVPSRNTSKEMSFVCPGRSSLVCPPSPPSS